jgi:hypothetical protein
LRPAFDWRPLRFWPLGSGLPPIRSKYSVRTSAALSLQRVSDKPDDGSSGSIHVVLSLPGPVLGLIVPFPSDIEFEYALDEAVAMDGFHDVSIASSAPGDPDVYRMRSLVLPNLTVVFLVLYGSRLDLRRLLLSFASPGRCGDFVFDFGGAVFAEGGCARVSCCSTRVG